VTVVLVAWQVPTWVSFRISRPAMDRMARQLMADPQSAPQDSWLGLYAVKQVSATSNGVWFEIANSGFTSQSGFIYSPDGPPKGTYEDHYVPMGRGWYAWWVEF
jgi:hypothetical protein